MIYYEASWPGLVFRFRGTILESTWQLLIVIVVLKFLLYYYEVEFDSHLGSEGHTILGSTMSYLLVFRANTASQRYWYSRKTLTQLFLSTRSLVMLVCAAMKGGSANQLWRETRHKRGVEDANDIRASMARVNFIRWSLAFVTSLKLHTRVCNKGYMNGRLDWEQKRLVDLDRIKLRGLMTRQEFEEVNALVPILNEPHITRGAVVLTPDLIDDILDQPLDEWYEVDTSPDMRQPLAILLFIRAEITRHANEPWGFKERFSKDLMGFCNMSSNFYEQMTMVITTPIPFPYVHLCKVLLIVFLFVSPVLINTNSGFFEDVIVPSFIALALLGIDAIASELENPFGDDPTDLDVTGAIALFESECMTLLDACGDTKARRAFMPYEIPEDLLPDDVRAPMEFMCLRSQVSMGRQGHHSKESGGQRAPAADMRKVMPIEEEDEDEDDDPSQPLLKGAGGSRDAGGPRGMGSDLAMSGAMSGSQIGFRPMRTMSDSTVSLVEADERQVGDDVIGLSDGEDDMTGSTGACGLKAIPEDQRGSQSARVKMSHESASEAGDGGSVAGSSQSGGFQPMELGTMTIVLESAELLNEEGLTDGSHVGTGAGSPARSPESVTPRVKEPQALRTATSGSKSGSSGSSDLQKGRSGSSGGGDLQKSRSRSVGGSEESHKAPPKPALPESSRSKASRSSASQSSATQSSSSRSSRG